MLNVTPAAIRANLAARELDIDDVLRALEVPVLVTQGRADVVGSRRRPSTSSTPADRRRLLVRRRRPRAAPGGTRALQPRAAALTRRVAGVGMTRSHGAQLRFACRGGVTGTFVDSTSVLRSPADGARAHPSVLDLRSLGVIAGWRSRLVLASAGIGLNPS